MNCREFEERWNDVLDARSEGLPESDHALEAHVATCERCQAISARYVLLRQAVAAWGPPPTLSTAAIDRIRPLSSPPKPRRFVARWSHLTIPMATAAALLALAALGGYWRMSRPIADGADPAAIARTKNHRPIETALEEAKSATIDLAREASAPVARIGRDVFGSEVIVDPPTSRTDDTDLTTIDASSAATEMLLTVGERVNAGVRPISGSARHAFSFLLGPPPGPDKPSARPSGSL